MEQEKKTSDATPTEQPEATSKITNVEPGTSVTPEGSVPPNLTDVQVVSGAVGFYNFNPNNLIYSTGTAIGSTISKLDALSATMEGWNRDAIAGLQPGLDEYFTQRVEPIKNELESQLKDTKNSLSTMNEFIKENKDALTSLFSVQGKMEGLDAKVSSALDRIGKLEADKITNWNQSATVWTILIAAISLCGGLSALLVAVVALYLQFTK